ncbi:MAG: AI-2E family transporter [Phycisphaerales bacterium]|nr:AI-2E family transporter [Phycisphaerales bacterium]
MGEPATRYTFDRVVRMVLTAVGTVTCFLLVRYLADVLIPFAAAAVLAYVLNPLVTLLATRLRRRFVAVLLTLAGIGIVLFGLTVAAASLAVRQTRAFSSTMRAMSDSYREVLEATLAAPAPPPSAQEGQNDAALDAGASRPWFPLFSEVREAFSELSAEATGQPGAGPDGAPGVASTGEGGMGAAAPPPDASQRYRRFWTRLSSTRLFIVLRDLMPAEADLLQWALTQAKRLLQGGWVAITSGISAIAVATTYLVLTAVFLFFLLLDYPVYVQMGRDYLPPDYREEILSFLHEFDFVLRRYLRGQFVVAMLTGMILALGFSIIGLPLAIPMGLLVGALNMVPYLQSIALPPMLFLALMRPFEHSGATLAGSILLVLLVFAVTQVIQDTVLTPRIMGKATGLKPVAILLGVFIWGKLLGMLGLLLAIPLTSLGIAYYRRVVLRHGHEATRPSTVGPA